MLSSLFSNVMKLLSFDLNSTAVVLEYLKSPGIEPIYAMDKAVNLMEVSSMGLLDC